jgi:hypothetical protein
MPFTLRQAQDERAASEITEQCPVRAELVEVRTRFGTAVARILICILLNLKL